VWVFRLCHELVDFVCEAAVSFAASIFLESIKILAVQKSFHASPAHSHFIRESCEIASVPGDGCDVVEMVGLNADHTPWVETVDRDCIGDSDCLLAQLAVPMPVHWPRETLVSPSFFVLVFALCWPRETLVSPSFSGLVFALCWPRETLVSLSLVRLIFCLVPYSIFSPGFCDCSGLIFTKHPEILTYHASDYIWKGCVSIDRQVVISEVLSELSNPLEFRAIGVWGEIPSHSVSWNNIVEVLCKGAG